MKLGRFYRLKQPSDKKSYNRELATESIDLCSQNTDVDKENNADQCDTNAEPEVVILLFSLNNRHLLLHRK